MANGHGGKRRPRNPAPVSGPGRMSRRTDGGPKQVQAQMTGMNYGENKDFMDIQSSAPLSASSNVPQMSQAIPAALPEPAAPTPLFAPTQRPDEPVTAGAPVGVGPGPAQSPTDLTPDARALARFLPDLMRSAQKPDAPVGFVRFVHQLRNMQG